MLRRQHRPSFHQHQMQAHSERGQGSGASHGVGGAGSPDHQAGGGQHTLSVRALHRLVHGWGGAEVVGGDDQARWRGGGHGPGALSAWVRMNKGRKRPRERRAPCFGLRARRRRPPPSGGHGGPKPPIHPDEQGCVAVTINRRGTQ